MKITRIYNSNGKIIIGEQLGHNYNGTITIRNPVSVFSILGRTYLRSYCLYSTITIENCKNDKVSSELHDVYSRFILMEYILDDLPRKEFIYFMKWNFCSRLLLPFLALAKLLSGDRLKEVKKEIKRFRDY